MTHAGLHIMAFTQVSWSFGRMLVFCTPAINAFYAFDIPPVSSPLSNTDVHDPSLYFARWLLFVIVSSIRLDILRSDILPLSLSRTSAHNSQPLNDKITYAFVDAIPDTIRDCVICPVTPISTITVVLNPDGVHTFRIRTQMRTQN
jgi:hypothetical protein